MTHDARRGGESQFGRSRMLGPPRLPPSNDTARSNRDFFDWPGHLFSQEVRSLYLRRPAQGLTAHLASMVITDQ